MCNMQSMTATFSNVESSPTTRAQHVSNMLEPEWHTDMQHGWRNPYQSKKETCLQWNLCFLTTWGFASCELNTNSSINMYPTTAAFAANDGWSAKHEPKKGTCLAHGCNTQCIRSRSAGTSSKQLRAIPPTKLSLRHHWMTRPYVSQSLHLSPKSPNPNKLRRLDSSTAPR